MPENTRPLRIVYLIGQLGLGGSERQLYLLLRHIDKARFEPHVVVFNPSPNYTLDDDLRAAGVAVHAIPLESTGVLRRILWIYRLLRRLRPQIVHSWSIHDNAYAAVVGLMAGVPRRLGSVRGSLASPDFLQFAPPIRWLILHGVQGLLVNSDAIAGQLADAGISARQVQVLPNCVSHTASATAAGGLPNGRLVGMVANLRREKNFSLFIRALAEVLPEFPDVHGVIAGQPVPASDPDIPDLIRGEIERLGLSGRIHLLGFRADIPAVLDRLEAFCLTSDSEGMPNALLEAMAAGLPVIATRVGAVPQLIDSGKDGLLVEPGEVIGLAEAIRTVLLDREAALEMGAAARLRMDIAYDCVSIVRRLENYYDSLVARGWTD